MRLRTRIGIVQIVILGCLAAGVASQRAIAAAPRNAAEDFIGLSDADVTQRLGSPALATSDPPAQMWRYSLDDCMLYLFFYAREGESTPQVTHAEFAYSEMAPGTEIVPRACLPGDIRSPASAGD